MENAAKRLADNLKRIRTSLRPRMTRERAAEALGIHPTTLYRWETGDSEPSIQVLERLASIYKVTLGELMGQERPLTAELSATQMDAVLGAITAAKGVIATATSGEIKRLEQTSKVASPQAFYQTSNELLNRILPTLSPVGLKYLADEAQEIQKKEIQVKQENENARGLKKMKA